MTNDECLHTGEVEVYFTGGYHFVGGEVWDDLCEHVVCVECGEHVDCESLCEDQKRPREVHIER